MVAIVGAGPAGLRAAECAARAGAEVTVFEAKPSAGRKFLVAGRGGLNLTYDAPPAQMAERYLGPAMPDAFWPGVLADFGSDELRAWAAELGCETFVASSGRVYPRALKSAPLLRAWLRRLRELGVRFEMRHRLVAIEPGIRLRFESDGGEVEVNAKAVVLALGGGSWPQTGSDGAWVSWLRQSGVTVSALQPANCGWELAWPAEVLAVAEGKPLKNLAVRAGDFAAKGELLVTKYGLEGGAIYQVGSALRKMDAPAIQIDFKPESSAEQLMRKLGGSTRWSDAKRAWRLNDATSAVIEFASPDLAQKSPREFVSAVKGCAIALTKPRPIDEAISSAGGVCWSELDDSLMLRQIPSVFVAGEMIDWEAPTGGFLLQGAFATGTRAGSAAAKYALGRDSSPSRPSRS